LILLMLILLVQNSLGLSSMMLIFIELILMELIFTKAKLANTQFTKADLSGANFHEAEHLTALKTIQRQKVYLEL